MEVSLSKGVFLRKGTYKIGQRKKQVAINYSDEPWYTAYKEAWSFMEKSADAMNTKTTKQIFTELHDFVSEIKDTELDPNLNEIPTAILLTGVNLSDHGLFFEKLMQNIESVTPHLAILWSINCSNVKSIMENMVYQFISPTNEEIKKSNCTFRALSGWYKDQKKMDQKKPLVVILPDFESVPEKVLHDFINILSSYMDSVKFTLVLGVATSVYAVQKSLTYDVTSKLRFKVFYTQKQLTTLSNMMEDIVMSPETLFHVIGGPLVLLSDRFLYNDLSVRGFLQNYKICMMKHFLEIDTRGLCCKEEDVERKINSLSPDEILEITKIPSIEKHVETSKAGKRKSFTDAKIKDLLLEMIKKFHSYMREFVTLVKCLHRLTSTLPKAPLGKELREVYAAAITEGFIDSQKYRDALRLLDFTSKQELLTKLEVVISIAEDPNSFVPKDFVTNLRKHYKLLDSASQDLKTLTPKDIAIEGAKTRRDFSDALKKMSLQKTTSPFKEAWKECIDYLDKEVFSVCLQHPTRIPGWEIFCFNDKFQVKEHILGPVKGAIYNALQNPCRYLECNCCKEIATGRSMPDICILYKLHLESSKLINVYDWLQTFLAIVNPNDEGEEQRDVDPQMHARFTHAMSYLEFLGIIARSGRKKHHVKRLTSNGPS